MINSDISGNYRFPTVTGLLGEPLPPLSTGFLEWNGTSWVFSSGGGGSVTGSGAQYQLALWTSASNLSGLTNGSAGTILQSNGTGANPSWVTALHNGTTATTQAAGDNSTNVATTAYVNAAVPSTTPQTLTDSSAITWNINSGINAYLLLTTAVGSTRTLTISNPAAGQNYTLEIQQASTGGQALTFTGITVKAAGAGGGAVVLSTANSAIDVINFYYTGSVFLVTYAVSFT